MAPTVIRAMPAASRMVSRSPRKIGKDCHQHHTQFVEWSDLSGIAKAEGAEIA
jgi:hypothetical protein